MEARNPLPNPGEIWECLCWLNSDGTTQTHRVNNVRPRGRGHQVTLQPCYRDGRLMRSPGSIGPAASMRDPKRWRRLSCAS